jgi:hypothetical protein
LLQTPALHTSVVHGLPSAQSAFTTQEAQPAIGVFWQPLSAWHESVVQALPSLQLSGVPAVHTPAWHASAPLQRLPSRHGVPFSTAPWVQPKTGSQLSVVHALASLQLRTVPAVHTPSWQVSSPLQTLPSVQEEPFRMGVLEQPETGLQLSAVHTLPSLQLSAVPGVQVPPWQVSAPLQTLPSLHAVPFASGVFVHPVTGSQASVVHTFASLQVRGVPAVQVPLWQTSLPLQTVPSPHAVPFSTGVCEQPTTGSQLSVVQTLLSLQLRAVPAVHVPLWQVSAPLQTLPSPQAVPFATAVF